jgi:membrane-bound inhibitor of C-type lysozyme
MQRAVHLLMSIAMLTACASRQGSTVGTPLTQPTMLSYSCAPTLSLRVRVGATSATVMVDGDGPFTLPQVTSRSDYAVYSDGAHTLQLYRDQASYGVGRGLLHPCSRS